MGRAGSTIIATLLLAVLVATAAATAYLRFRPDIVHDVEHVLRLGHGLPADHPVHEGMVYMAERLHELSDGTVELRIYPNEQLGTETHCTEQLQHGVLDMAKISAAPMETFVPEVAVVSLPYVFRDSEHYWAVLDGEVGQGLLEAGVPRGLRGLCFYDAGARSFYTVDGMVREPANLEGKRIRVQESPTAMALVRRLGGSPTPIAWGELYSALEQGVVDGAENNPPSFLQSNHYRVARHFSLNEHARVPDVLLMSEDTWQRLPEDVQQWVQQAARESSEYQRNLWEQATQEAIETLEDRGVEIYRPDPAHFAELVEPMHDEITDPRILDLLKRIRDLD